MDNPANSTSTFPPRDYVDQDDVNDFGESPEFNIKEDAINKAQKFRDFANERAATIKQEATVKFKQGALRAKELHHTAEDYVRDNPTKSVLGAVGLGVIIGLIMRR